MKKEKWTTDLSSVEAKRRNLARPELSENAVLFSTDDNCFLYFRGLDSLANDHQHMTFFENVNLSEMVKCLEDLIDYFAQPEENIGLA
jgi:hypothetical protein